VISIIIRLSAGWVGYCRTDAGLWALTLPQAGEQEVVARLRALAALGEVVPPGDSLDELLRTRLEAYFSGLRVAFPDVPLDWSGYSPFVRAVLKTCRAVPFGRTSTYGELARAVGSPRAARAVGNALGANRTPVVVPCHRIVRSDGSFGGFTGGREWKERLLALERPEALHEAK